MKKSLFVVAAMLLAVACAKKAPRHEVLVEENYLASHPEWAAQGDTLVREHLVVTHRGTEVGFRATWLQARDTSGVCHVGYLRVEKTGSSKNAAVSDIRALVGEPGYKYHDDKQVRLDDVLVIVDMAVPRERFITFNLFWVNGIGEYRWGTVGFPEQP